LKVYYLTDHPECLRVGLFLSWLELPHRVVDLSHYYPPSSSRESLIRVIKTNGSHGAYCALSYRWPEDLKRLAMLSRHNTTEMSEGVPAHTLLGEIQDICTLAKGLGINYVWVDALVRSS
jgi:hypothetical protein